MYPRISPRFAASSIASSAKLPSVSVKGLSVVLSSVCPGVVPVAVTVTSISSESALTNTVSRSVSFGSPSASAVNFSTPSVPSSSAGFTLAAASTAPSFPSAFVALSVPRRTEPVLHASQRSVFWS